MINSVNNLNVCFWHFSSVAATLGQHPVVLVWHQLNCDYLFVRMFLKIPHVQSKTQLSVHSYLIGSDSELGRIGCFVVD